MKTDAQAHAADDRKRKEEIDIKNQADNLVFQTEKQLKEFGDKVNSAAKNKIEAANNNLKEAIKSADVGRIKTAIEELNTSWNEASAQMYQQATESGQQGPQPGPSPDQGAPKTEEKKVEDATYEVVDEEKKK